MASLPVSRLFEPSRHLPPAGPNVKPQLVEVIVGPWRRISVLFRPAHVAASEETGAIWYWRPEAVARLEPPALAA